MNLRSAFLLILVGVIVGLGFAVFQGDAEEMAPIVPPPGVSLLPLHVEGRDIVNSAGQKVILQGAAVAYLKYSADRGKPVLKRDLAMIKAWGGNVVRIPVTPGDFISVGAEAYLSSYVDDIVRWAGELGLYAVVSWKAHGDPWRQEAAVGVYTHLKATVEGSLGPLSDISRRYSACDWVLYSVWNENPAMSWSRFRQAMVELVDVVRRNDPDALVLVPGTHIATKLKPIVADPIPSNNVIYVSDIYQGSWYGKPWWRDEAVYLLESGYPLMIGEWGFGYSEVGGVHTSTPEDFGRPFLNFCEEHAISWTAWQWTHRFEIPMFYDYERLRPTPFGETVREYLGQYGTPTSFPEVEEPVSVEVFPAEAYEAGCRAEDLLQGHYEDVPYAILRPVEEGPWVFDHWEGPVDRPRYRVVSAELCADEPIVAVFRPNGAGTFDWSKADFVIEFPEDPEVSYWCDWRDGTYSLEDAHFWGLPGCHIKEIRIAFQEDSLLARWGTYDDDVLGTYSYLLTFRDPASEETALYVTLYPAEKRATVCISTPDKGWQDLGTEFIMDTYFDESTAAIQIADLQLAGGTWVHDLRSWVIAATLVHTGRTGYSEFFGFRTPQIRWLLPSASGPVTEIDWKAIPEIISYAEQRDVHFGFWDSETGYHETDELDRRFGDHGWKLSSLHGGLVEQGIALELCFADGDGPGMDPGIDYIVTICDSQNISIRPGAATVSIHGSERNREWKPDTSFVRLGDRSLWIVIPYDIMDGILNLDELLSGCKVNLHVAYRGKESHGFVFYDGSGKLMDLTSQAQPGSSTAEDVPQQDCANVPINLYSLLASLGNDLPEDPGSNFAEEVTGACENGTYGGMRWTSPDPTDLTIFVQTGAASSVKQIKLTLSASPPTDVRVWIVLSEGNFCGKDSIHLSSEEVLRISETPDVYVLPLSSFDLVFPDLAMLIPLH